MSEFSNDERFRRDHRWAPGRMSAFLDGELATEGRIRMERHVGECIECRRLLAGLRRVLDALHSLPTLAVEADAVGLAASVRLRLNDPPSA
jgi:anti-sigma factor RsiW